MTQFLTDRLMRAAATLIQHGEVVEVRYVGFGEWRNCLILGEGDKPGTVRLGVWCAAGEIREGRKRDGSAMPIRFCDCLIPEATQARLEQVAREQETVSRFDPISGRRYATLTAEVERAIEFATTAQRQRTRDGRFADGLHRAEPAGVR